MNSSQRAVLSAFRLQKSVSHPYALMRTARIGVVNRYKYVSNTCLVRPSDSLLLLDRITRARMSISSAR